MEFATASCYLLILTDALAAGASIIGTGTTMEGINQNPAYYEYTYDTAWHREAQPLQAWFKGYASRRYGVVDNADAQAAWELLRTTVYNYAGCGSFGGYHDGTGVEWKVWGAPPTCPSPTAANVTKAWSLLVDAGRVIDPTKYETLNYDIVNTGREVLAQLITTFEASLVASANAGDKAAAMATGTTLLGAYTDLDELVGCDASFLIGPWIAEARKWANATDAEARFYEWQARSQVSTWWPVSTTDVDRWTANYTKGPPLDGYANKHWNGLVRDFYGERVKCYVAQVGLDLGSSHPLNTTNITRCAVKAEMAFTQTTATKYAEKPTPTKTLPLSKALLAKYQRYL